MEEKRAVEDALRPASEGAGTNMLGGDTLTSGDDAAVASQ